MVAKERAEEELLDHLCCSDNPLSNFSSIKQTYAIKRSYDEAQERFGFLHLSLHFNIIIPNLLY